MSARIEGMSHCGTTLHCSPKRLALLKKASSWPPPPPRWQILTDERWEVLQGEFDLPKIQRGVFIRAFLEVYCVGLHDYKSELRVRARGKSDDKIIRWMSKPANIGKSYSGEISQSVTSRLSFIAQLINKAAGRIIAPPRELNRIVSLTLPIQLCALVCWDQGGTTRGEDRGAILEFYAAMYRMWETFLDRRVTIWAHQNGRASSFVRLATHLLCLCRELPADDALARLRVRARLEHAKKSHPNLFSGLDFKYSGASEGCETAIVWRRSYYRRTQGSGFSHRRP